MENNSFNYTINCITNLHVAVGPIGGIGGIVDIPSITYIGIITLYGL